MRRIVDFLSLSLFTFMLGGCATKIDPKATSINWTKGSILVTSVNTVNEHKPKYGPTSLGVVANKLDKQEEQYRASLTGDVASGTNTALVHVQVPSGSYAIKRLFGTAVSFPIRGTIDFAVDSSFVVPPKSVLYLDHLDLKNREKTNQDNQATGYVTPLIDQSITGFSNGMLKVSVTDDFESDIAKFKSEFPVVRVQTVINLTLQKISLKQATGSKAPNLVVTR